jgi:hypothetical protein
LISIIDLVENIKKINNQKLFIENILKSFENDIFKNLDDENYKKFRINILRKIEFLVQVIRKLKYKIEKFTN